MLALLTWIEFAGCAALIWLAGGRLLRYADLIADRTGVSRTWIGVVLLASVTSLPELVTGVSSVSFASVPNIAVGDVLGSCVFNLVILTVLDLFARGESVYRRAARGHVLSAGFGIVLLGTATLGVLLVPGGLVPAWGRVGLTSPVILLVYLFAMRTVFRYEEEGVEEAAEEAVPGRPDLPLRTAAAHYAGWALVVVVTALALPFVGRQLARAMGWETSFVGNVFVAFATSTPEVMVTIAAARLGALNLAIGNLLGSNLFNVAILALDDLLYAPGPILAGVEPIHAASAVIATIMTAVAVVGLIFPPRRRVFGTVSWAGVALLLLYVLNVLVMARYHHGT